MKGHGSHAPVLSEQMAFSASLAHTLFGVSLSFLAHNLYCHVFLVQFFVLRHKNMETKSASYLDPCD